MSGKIESGRMYLSYGEPVYITFNTAADGTVGYAGPDLNNPSDPNSTYNYYSAFMHKHSVNNFAYGFCYDDVNDQSTLLHYTNPTALVLDLKW